MNTHAKILLVDDHSIMRQGVKLILASEPALEVVGEAANATEAVAKAGELHPDVVVMDIHLTASSGLEATRQILAAHPATKIVVLTAETSPEVVDSMLQSGISAYILKEEAGEELVHAIHTALNGKFYLCPAITTALIRAKSLSAKPVTAHKLTDREKELMRCVAGGLRNKEIAEKLGIGIKSVEVNRSRLMTKVGCASSAELVRYAVREGIAKL